jgi:hypothetical protein
MAEHTWRETIEAKGEEIIKKIEHVIAEGNVRKIEILHDGQIIASFSLTIGVIGAVLALVLAAIGAIAAILTDCRIEIERVGERK